MTTALNQWTATTAGGDSPAGRVAQASDGSTLTLDASAGEVRRTVALDLTQGPLVLDIPAFSRPGQSADGSLKVGFNCAGQYGEFTINRKTRVCGYHSSYVNVSFDQVPDGSLPRFRFTIGLSAHSLAIEQRQSDGSWLLLSFGGNSPSVPAGNFFPPAATADWQTATAYVDLDGSAASGGTQVFGPWYPSGLVTIAGVALSPATSTPSGGVTTVTYTGTATLSDGTTRAITSADGAFSSDLGSFGGVFGVFTDPTSTSSAQTAHVTFTVPANAGTGQAAVTATATRTIPGVTPTSIALGCGATATLINGQTLALAPVVTPGGASQAVDYTIAPNVGSINGSHVYTPPAQQASAQTVMITARPAGQSSPSAVVTVTIPSNTPTIRVLDGVTPVANGAVVPVMRQAATAPLTRYVYVDNGSGPVSGGDNALTGLAVSVSPAASWLTVALNQTTAGAVLSLAVTSPSAVPGTADPDVTVTVASSVAGVAPRTFVVPGAVAAASTSGFTLAQVAQQNRIEQMLLPLSSSLTTLSALGGTTQDKLNQMLTGSLDQAGLQTLIDARVQAQLAAAGVTTDRTAKLGALVVDGSGRVTTSTATGLTDPQMVLLQAAKDAATSADGKLSTPRLNTLDELPAALTTVNQNALAAANGVAGVPAAAAQAVAGAIGAGVSAGFVAALSAPRPAITTAPPVDGASFAQMWGYQYATGHGRNLQIADDTGVSTFGADGVTLLARKTASQGASALTTAVVGA